MKIDSLKQLEQLIKLCRKTGVVEIKADNIDLKLGITPYKARRRAQSDDPMADLKIPVPNITDAISAAKQAAAQELQRIQDYIETDEPSEEQLMNWSVRNEAGHEQ
jgi:hypothetical protein